MILRHKLKFKPFSNPIMLLSDAPEALTGLARIGRDLASLLCTMPQFRVAYLGRGGIGRRKFPWTSYQFPEQAQWGEEHLPYCWSDFAGDEAGIVMSLWDASRMLWFGCPESLQQTRPDLSRSLGSGRNFYKWGYFPVDGVGPNGSTLPLGMAQATAGYDRLLAASEWGKCVIARGGRPDADWIPHGIWMDKFRPRNSEAAPVEFVPGAFTVGCNMANQSRKDWPVAFECAALLKSDFGNRFQFWIHTDRLVHYWNLYALAADYGVQDCLVATTELSDEQLALRYSACDCTLLPSGGEGFGFPIAESLACGTACVVTDYAAGQELVEDECRVPVVTYKVDTQHNVQRAVLSGHAFALKVKAEIEKKRSDPEGRAEQLHVSVEHLDWNKLKNVWERWFMEGLC